MSITDCKKKNQNLIITNLASNKNWLLIVLFSSIPLLQNQLIAGSNSSFCADWAEENTSWFASKYRYEYSKNYNYCLSNANYLIEQYGVTRITFVPYVFFPGLILQRNIMGSINKYQQLFPDIEFALCPPLGITSELCDIAVDRVSSALQVSFE